MKKKRLSALALLAPLALLVGCGGTMTLGFSSNWYYDNTVENPTGKSERLEYEVSFLENATDGVSVHYEKGTYVTELTAETESSALLYRFHTELNITGNYANGGAQGDTFEDFMVSDVWFTRAEEGLRPVKSRKSVHATVPYSSQNDPSWYTTYEFTYGLTYAQDLSDAEYSLDIAAPESRKTSRTGTIELGYEETFLDNEQIPIALRGLNLSSANSLVPFVTVDPQTQRPVTVKLGAESVSTAVSFELNGEQIEGNIDAVRVSAAYDMAQPGPTRSFFYAARKDENSKKYRSVLLRFENAAMYNLGTMTYTLKKATFNDN